MRPVIEPVSPHQREEAVNTNSPMTIEGADSSKSLTKRTTLASRLCWPYSAR